jgi:hypothetical protein
LTGDSGLAALSFSSFASIFCDCFALALWVGHLPDRR